MSGARAVCYLRVSTARQGASGLGLEAQRAAVMAHVAAHGLTVAAEFVEVESGKRDDRPQLTAALGACRLHRAQLVIAKLDRLARNVAFIANLMDGGCDFVACDMPHANRLTLHLMAAMAEHEREMISQRTKAALAAAKARGTRLGNPNGAAHLLDGCRQAAAASAARRRADASQRDMAVAPILAELAASGVTGGRRLAYELNMMGVPAPSAGIWSAGQVRVVARRLA
jgi:DNA invertase Pin-like site-specific DNA recombinase